MTVLEIDGAPFHINLAAVLSAPKLARMFLAQLLDLWGIKGERAETAVLLVSELATNAVEATNRLVGPDRQTSEMPDASITVRARVTRTALHIEVFDRDPSPPTLQHPDADSEGGRGLFLVDVLADEWGWVPVSAPSMRSAGKWAWFTLTLPSPPHPRNATAPREPIVPDEVISPPRARTPARPARPQPASSHRRPEAALALPQRVGLRTAHDPEAIERWKRHAPGIEVMRQLHAALINLDVEVAA